MNEKQLLQIIAKARKGEATELDLSGKNLTVVPAEVDRLLPAFSMTRTAIKAGCNRPAFCGRLRLDSVRRAGFNGDGLGD
jgi:hypothetical protein